MTTLTKNIQGAAADERKYKMEQIQEL